jgi:hypothetical protein
MTEDKIKCAVSDDLASWEKPNGFVVRGPKETPVLVAFEEDGSVSNRGAEVEGIERMFPDGLTRDRMILVHVIEGDGTMLVKQLEVNKLIMDGEPVDVAVLVIMDKLNDMAISLRDKYVLKKGQEKQDEENL